MEALRRLSPADLASVMHVYLDLLRSHQEAINRLNVYPVPDGDTGTNMALTIESVVAELDETPDSDQSLKQVCGAIAHGSLMGARGNSGVILSQLLRGISGVFGQRASQNGDSPDRPDTDGPAADSPATDGPGADGPLLADALVAASEAARKAVLRPVEGTILTVAHEAGQGAKHAAESGASLVEVVEKARDEAALALARTPEQLPVLARAGVVDAGGSGYLLFLDALLNVADGRVLPEPPPESDAKPKLDHFADRSDTSGDLDSEGGEVASGRGLRYEVMYLLDAPDDTVPAFKDVWAGLGDSIVVVGGGGLWNCHIHTDDVGGAIEAALDAGRPRNIRVTDLEEQIEEERWVREGGLVPYAEDPGHVPRTAVIAVATGEGIARIFRSLGVHYIVPGGQSMNPSTSQILEVVDSVPSPEVVLLPNNENIQPVAMQVVELATKPVTVVPTSGIVEGFAALLEYDPESDAKDNAANMAASARRIVSGEVTRAVRSTDGPTGPIEKGDWLGLSREGIEVVGSSLADVCCSLLEKLLERRHELVTLIEGEGARPFDTRRVTEWLAENHESVAVEVHHGGQPLYPYLISIE
jgi:DAK2 domain fusion protein YloV